MARELPILFNTEMVQAILDGRKTVTRRLIKKSQCVLLQKKDPSELKDSDMYAPFDGMAEAEVMKSGYKPPYRQGDILYVRETWSYNPDLQEYYYKANRAADVKAPYELKWHPSIHMPKEAARIWLRVKDVRVERLQDITADDIRREGMASMSAHVGDMEIALNEWKILWNATLKRSDIGRYGWEANPFVWVIAFERCRNPEKDETTSD